MLEGWSCVVLIVYCYGDAGMVPVKIGRLTQLVHLDLSVNKLTGKCWGVG